MKIRMSGDAIKNILEAIDGGKFSAELHRLYDVNYRLTDGDSYIEIKAKNGKETFLSRNDWAVLSSYVI